MIYALIIFVGGFVQPLGWFHTREQCVEAAREIANEVDLSPFGEDDVSCVAYVVSEEKRS